MTKIILNNKEIKLKAISLSSYEDPKDFFSYCLEHELYKTAENYNSRLKNLYNHKKEWQGLSAVVALHNDKPIGICVLEHREINKETVSTQAGILKMTSRAKDPWQFKYDWHFIHAGFLSFYVKPPYRNIGLAKALLSEMEKHQYNTLPEKNLNESIRKNIKNNCFVVTCQELAQKIVSSSKLFYGVECDTNKPNYHSNLSAHTYHIVFEEAKKKSIGEFKSTQKISKNLRNMK